MKKLILTAAALVLGVGAVLINAQDAPRPGERERPPGGSERRGDMSRFRLPLMAALDPNNDNVIDKTEIENASANLKKLDKNSDGQLTAEELRPPRPEGRPDSPRRPGGTGTPERPVPPQ
jgi:hypothetical protein